MKIVSSKRINQELARMNNQHIMSSNINSLFSYAVNETTTVPRNLELLRRRANALKSEFSQYSEDELMEYSMIEELMITSRAFDTRDTYDWYISRIAKDMKVFYPDEFLDNPYIKNIRFDTTVCGRFRLDYGYFDPFELFFYDTAQRDDNMFADIPCIGCFPEKFYYPCILEEDRESWDNWRVWMSVTPNEVCTMENNIAHAKGKVLTLGCGMGYFAYMASLKEDVTSVTIVECEQDVIDLFQNYILPQFEYKDKIEIVKGDAVEYLRNVEDGKFDYCFADTWIGINDLEPYFAVKKAAQHLKQTDIEYWLEEAIGLYLSNYVWCEIMESFLNVFGETVPENISYKNQAEKRVFTYIKSILEKEEISKPSHLHYYLKPENIISLINNTDIIF